MLLMDKSWIAKEKYNEFLSKKMEIGELKNKAIFYERKGYADDLEETEEAILECAREINEILSEMENTYKVDMKELILLALGVDTEKL